MSELIKIALIMNQNNYAGREYLSKLTDLQIDVISIGEYPEFDNDGREQIENNLFATHSQHTPLQLPSKPSSVRVSEIVTIEWE